MKKLLLLLSIFVLSSCAAKLYKQQDSQEVEVVKILKRTTTRLDMECKDQAGEKCFVYFGFSKPFPFVSVGTRLKLDYDRGQGKWKCSKITVIQN